MWREGLTRGLEAVRHRFGARSAASARSRERIQGLQTAMVSLADDLTLDARLDRAVHSASARLFEDRERQLRWLEMTTEVTDQLLAALHPVDVYSLDLVAGRARDVSDSALAVIAVVAGDGAGLLCRTSVGLEILPTGRDLPSSTAVAQVLRTGRSAAVSAAKDVLGSAAAQNWGRP